MLLWLPNIVSIERQNMCFINEATQAMNSSNGVCERFAICFVGLCARKIEGHMNVLQTG